MSAAKLQQALALQRQGDLAQAAALYKEILATEPGNADALHYLGLVAYATGNGAEALSLINAALARVPNNVAALINRASVARLLGKRDTALADYDRALVLEPANADALGNRGVVLTELGRAEEALASIDRAIALNPRSVALAYNRGNALLRLERRRDAIAAYDAALALAPDHRDASFNRGKALLELERPREAIPSLRRACMLDPNFGEAQWTEALCHLLAGDFAQGWPLFEARWHIPPQSQSQRAFAAPLWTGNQDIAGKAILVHAEQGFGDSLQFVRYLPRLAARGARVIFQGQPELKALIEAAFDDVRVFAPGDALPPFDIHCPLLSLPLVFGTTLATIPAAVPYVKAPAARSARWQTLLPADGKPRIGLAWAGRGSHANDRHRSIEPAALTPLLNDAATFVCLQTRHRGVDRAWLAAHPQVIDPSAAVQDFADSAALAAAMDLVITVDTSIAHLAGALARPTWILLPFIALDWRWLLAREDSPWYPTARLFRQREGEPWTAVIDRVAQDLGAKISARH